MSRSINPKPWRYYDSLTCLQLQRHEMSRRLRHHQREFPRKQRYPPGEVRLFIEKGLS